MTEQRKTKELIPNWRIWLNHRWIAKNITFFLFLAVLAVIYIANGHYADKTVRNINRAARELNEMQYEYKTLKSEVLFRSRQSKVVEAVKDFGLKESIGPAVVLTDSLK